MSAGRGPIHILDADDNDTGDTALFWQMSADGRLGARHGVDLNYGGRKIQVHMTRARHKLRIFIDGVEWKP